MLKNMLVDRNLQARETRIAKCSFTVRSTSLKVFNFLSTIASAYDFKDFANSSIDMQVSEGNN